ncbi:E3 ubiquitin/ISG15 ligase TRIM25-like [Kryptolebias marmoratus]|uniref:E3 ubiquitin/ISG15 ligase TRIM25-like n=1 Tax=Kryptolebias marmoratus TaxID=37003 RepID=A0A3Q2ZBS4_KRYMA|nr:E3 ubiquitin/ISG15 ligase TRIM25-like [Kryptolebias marmoratus]
MAHSSELFDCSICLQLLVDPVTTACGHSYCMACINTFWNTKPNNAGKYSCPQCQTTFKPRPVLQKNTLLANLLEDHKKKTSQSAAADEEEDPASPGDVLCDVCTDKKRKAKMFCLTCLVSYCEAHLQPHLEVAALKKHHLIQASARIKEIICSRHDSRLEIYCRSDGQLLCSLCVVEHKGHDIVKASEEVHEKQKLLDRTRQEVADRVKVSQSKMDQLMDAAHAIRDAAWKECHDFEQQCSEHIALYVHSLEKKCFEMRRKVGELEKTGVDRTKSHFGSLEREVYQLRQMENKLRQLSQTDNPIQFLQDFQALGELPVFTNPQERLDALTEFVTAHKDKLKLICNKEKDESFSHFKDRTTLLIEKFTKKPDMEISSRKDILSRCEHTTLKLDPDTVNACLYVTQTKKEISWGITGQAHPDHPDRFTYYYQALCQTGLQGNHYWEVKWDGGIVEVAVSYKKIHRKGSGKDSCFGHNKLSWKLTCSPSGCTFWHNSLHRGQIPPARSRRLGVHLEYDKGKLSFYSVSSPDRLTLLHQIQTRFTEPVYPGFSVDLGATLEIY